MAQIFSNTRVDNLCEKFPDIPRSIVVKADVLREGMRKTPLLQEIAQWAMHDPHWLFDWDHDDLHTHEEADEMGAFVPELFQLIDHTTVKIILDAHSPYEIAQLDNGRYVLLWNDKPIEEVFFPRKPRWYSQKASDGTPLSSIASLKGADTFACCVFSHCEYFNTSEECRYCCINWNIDHQRDLGVDKKIAKRIDHVAQAAAVAFEEGHVRHVTFTGGALMDRSKEADLYARVVKAIAKSTGHENDTVWGEVISQAFEKEDAIKLKEAGLQAVCWNLEVWDPHLFEVVCPGKARHVGRENWLRNLVEAVPIFGRGNVCSSFVSGAEMAKPEGFKTIDEALESTLGGFEWLIQRGVAPRFNMWSNVAGSVYASQEIPPTEYWLRLGKGWHRLMKHYQMYPYPTCVCRLDIHRSIFGDFRHLAD